jgi:hypothetical protein
MATLNKKEHVCSNCIELFNEKELYTAKKPGREYTTIYCKKCIDFLGITEFNPRNKRRSKKAK